jgi:hypothetical protein
MKLREIYKSINRFYNKWKENHLIRNIIYHEFYSSDNHSK